MKLTLFYIISFLLISKVFINSHIVVQGDTCWGISQKYSISLNQLLSYNPGLNCSSLSIGQEIKTQIQQSSTYTVVSGDTCWGISQKNSISLDQLTSYNPGLNCSNLSIGQKITIKIIKCIAYTVISGDSCWEISQKYKTNEEILKSLNESLNCSNLSINQVIYLPITESSNENKAEIKITFDQFTKAVTIFGYPSPTESIFTSFLSGIPKGNISSLRELAMFLSNILIESGGLVYKKELKCIPDECPSEYRSEGDPSNIFYYGRGYIQLTWSYNYKAASIDLYGDDRLCLNPDLVSNNEDVAWDTTFWFWKVNVHSKVQDGRFGSSINAINGYLECNPCRHTCSRRGEYYLEILKIFGVNEVADLSGC